MEEAGRERGGERGEGGWGRGWGRGAARGGRWVGPPSHEPLSNRFKNPACSNRSKNLACSNRFANHKPWHKLSWCHWFKSLVRSGKDS